MTLQAIVDQIRSQTIEDTDEARQAHSAKMAEIDGAMEVSQFAELLDGQTGVLVLKEDEVQGAAVAVARDARTKAMQTAYEAQDFDEISAIADRYGFEYVNKLTEKLLSAASHLTTWSKDGQRREAEGVSEMLENAISKQKLSQLESAVLAYMDSYGAQTWTLTMRGSVQETESDQGEKVENRVVQFEARASAMPRARVSGSSTGSGGGKETVVEFSDGRANQTFPSARKAGEGLGVTLPKNIGTDPIASKIGNNVEGVARVVVAGEVKWEAKS